MMEQLSVNKNTIFSSSVTDETLVRTGTISDGSCAYHSILHAFSKDYMKMNVEHRQKFVKKIRSNISKQVTKEKWLAIDNGLLSNLLFQQKFIFVLNKFKHVLNTNHSDRFMELDIKEDKKVYEILFEILPFNEEFEQNIIPQSIVENSIKETCENIIKIAVEKLKNDENVNQVTDTKKQYLVDKLKFILNYILKNTEKIAFEEYVSIIKNPKSFTDVYSINLISDWFNRNVLFINGDTRLPYKHASNYDPKRKTVILLWLNESHYEVVGKLLERNRVQREFSEEDDIIQKIKSHLDL